MDHPKFDVTVQLTGEDGNVFAVLGRVQRALRRAGATPEQISAYFDEATAGGSYDHVLATTMRWVKVA
jgi:hypothetical protein